MRRGRLAVRGRCGLRPASTMKYLVSVGAGPGGEEDVSRESRWRLSYRSAQRVNESLPRSALDPPQPLGPDVPRQRGHRPGRLRLSPRRGAEGLRS